LHVVACCSVLQCVTPIHRIMQRYKYRANLCKIREILTNSQIRKFANSRDPHKFANSQIGEILTNSQISRDSQIRKFANSQIREIFTSTRDPHKFERSPQFRESDRYSPRFATPRDIPTRFRSSKRAPQFVNPKPHNLRVLRASLGFAFFLYLRFSSFPREIPRISQSCGALSI